ncbi:MAG TPA: HAMP domain-containing sensor histidine kinase [Candidatus Acidoferrum sp.]|nr:HAMP domain-containing sensor histidine kinase [Candidatus Acidoferrum sp.]
MRVADVRAPLASLASLDRRLATLAPELAPLVVVRLPQLERVAWRRGRRAARGLERRASRAFASAVSGILRAEDLIAHDAGTDLYLAALVAPTRDGGGVAAPIDARSALARIAATMEATTRLEILTGWTTYEARSDAGTIDAVIERALVRGAQERERYAFFSALGHELRTPLSSIRGYLETLLDDEVDATTRKRFVGIAHNEALRMSRLVDGMFEISLLDLHAALPARMSGVLADAVSAARDACASNAAAHGVRMTFDEASPIAVAMDADRLTLLLVNLVDNAVKHGRAGGRVFVAIDEADRRFVRIIVDDDGPGIDYKDRDRVFGLGERASSVRNGTGIGLAVVRLIVERAGGRVELEESPLGGARFVVTVPRV